MPGTVASHITDVLLNRLAEVAGADRRSRSQVIHAALSLYLGLSPRGRRAADSVMAADGDERERAYFEKAMTRAALRAQAEIIDSRYADRPVAVHANAPLETEEEIEAEAVRMCAP